MKHVAIIGAGQVARTVHAPYYGSRRDELELAAVVDADQARAEDFCRQTGFGRAYASVDQLLEHEDIALASVCTPNRFHCEATLSLLDAGVNVLCEKPPAMTADQAGQMLTKSVERGCLLAYDFQHRFSDEAQLLKRHLSKLGGIYYVEAVALRRCGVPGWGDFIDQRLQGGGPLIDLGIHMLDAALHLLGFPTVSQVEAVSFRQIGPKKSQGAFGRWDPARFSVEDSLFGALRFGDGGLMRLSTSFALNIRPANQLGLLFCGDQAGATLYPAEIFRDVAGELEILDSVPPTPTDNHARCLAAFVNAALGRPSDVLATAQQGYEVQRIIDALYRSAEAEQPITL